MGQDGTKGIGSERIKSMKRIFIIVGVVISILLLPLILWFLDDKKTLQVAIIDKTVPNASFREHLGITWVLNHFGYVKKDGTAYNPLVDYSGFAPNEEKQSYSIKSLPESYNDMDVIYLADTYGVYKEDFPWIKKAREGSRSSLIYGGLQMKEWEAITDRLKQEKRSTFIAEFNSLASPTDSRVRKSMSEYLQLNWSGWTGRYFNELDYRQNIEIPGWIVDQYSGNWNYHGAGYVLINDVNNEIIVLEENKHFKGDGIKLKFTDTGKKQFGLKTSVQYNYWFDIVTPKNEEDVLAYYDWNLTESGKKELKNKDIPLKFAGVIANTHQNSKSYYLAGDFNDIAKTPTFYQMKGLSILQKIMNHFSEESFYWDTYVPMMKNILAESKMNLTEEKSNSSSKKGSTYTSRVVDDSFEVFVEGKWKKIKIKGVNIGMGKPGAFPGEAGITEEEYYRWLNDIGKMGANSIRVYTLHPPGFYNALKRYNEENKENPIYVFHGVWINEESLVNTLDAFDSKQTKEFQAEIKRLVDVIHGNAIVDPRTGHSSGVYKSDISPYVIGWIIGIEWYPQMVKNTNDKHKAIGNYDGKYFKTVKGAPFEYWLANQMDVLVSYEKEKYNWIRPVSFTNWVTTDLLTHPAEPNPDEDLVSVNPNVIQTKSEMKKTNQFASYHVYPYYPDFLNFEEKYTKYKDFRGEYNNYAAYLKDLHAKHKMPVLIAEFGVPASRGLTHENPFGLNQGFLSETEQGEILARLYEDIIHENMLGGLVFTWQDEWFKRTWNTMDYDNSDRRPYWSNAQTNEQQFGLLSFDRLKIKVDGETRDWNENSLFYSNPKGTIQKLYMDHDERYLYFRLNMTDVKNGHPMIVLDTITGQGNKNIDGIKNISFNNGLDFIIQIKGTNQSRVLVDAYYDFFMYQYGHQLKMIEPTPAKPTNNSGSFQPIQFALNKELYLPSEKKTMPFSAYETGKLRHGNANPDSQDYDSLADYMINEKEGIIEIRIPWMLLNVKDPSQKEVIGNIFKDGLDAKTKIDGIKAGVLLVQPNGKVAEAIPMLKHDKMPNMKIYSWKTWNQPKYEERLKKSYDIVKRTFTAD